MRRAGLVVGAVSLVVLAACGSKPAATSGSPPAATQAPSAASAQPPASIPPTPASSLPPSAPPGGNRLPPDVKVPKVHGRQDAKADVSGTLGQLDLSFTRITGYPIYAPPGGTVGVTWTDNHGNNLTLGGTLFQGTRPTSAKFSVQFDVVKPPDSWTFVSGNGSCDVTIKTADVHRFEGKVECPRLKWAGDTVAAAAAFSYRP
ncbi:MAG TPA: hypothetical protein VJ259_07660 [Actinomycetota bacterium]|nr:hypothetical protein [Actinomycetota bacterium]